MSQYIFFISLSFFSHGHTTLNIPYLTLFFWFLSWSIGCSWMCCYIPNRWQSWEFIHFHLPMGKSRAEGFLLALCLLSCAALGVRIMQRKWHCPSYPVQLCLFLGIFIPVRCWDLSAGFLDSHTRTLIHGLSKLVFLWEKWRLKTSLSCWHFLKETKIHP